MEGRLKEIYEVFDLMLTSLRQEEKRLEALLKRAEEAITRLESLLSRTGGVSDRQEEEDFLSTSEAKQVVEMYRQGLSPKEISLKSGIHIGKVELFINLYRAKNESSSYKQS